MPDYAERPVTEFGENLKHYACGVDAVEAD